MKSISSQLQKIGLSENESNIYRACLELGESTILPIVKRVNLPKTTAYETLFKLQKKGLVSSVTRRGKKYFITSSPQVLVDTLEEQCAIAKELLPAISDLYRSNSKTTRVRFFDGIEGLRVVTNEILHEATALHAIGSAEDIFTRPADFFDEFLKKRIAKKIPTHVIYSDSALARERAERDPRELKRTRIITANPPLTSTILFWNTKVCFITLKDEYHIVVIENPEIVNMINAIFQFMWGNR